MLKAGAVLFPMHRMVRKVLEGGSEEGGIEGNGLKLRDRQPIEAQGIAHLIQARECLQALREKRIGGSRQQEIQSKLMPGVTCIREKILDDEEQALNLEDLAQLLLDLSEQRGPRGLAHFRAPPRQEPEAFFACELAQQVFALDKNPETAPLIGNAKVSVIEFY